MEAFKLPDCPERKTHQRLPGVPKGAFLPPSRPPGVQGCPVYTCLGCLSFVPSPQAGGAKQQLAVTMAIAGAKLWLKRILNSRDLTKSVGEMAG